ncbi:hypothetical protein CXQ85_005212 [Candidozyma haemuli]|uniref:Pre-mRNA-splicing factor CWC2 n=1 Tax=Candidozyma haemuli TaxID=45357 RepID=A0A2V1AXQ9_9ASCO|nr:hypothetical protein CXQ85_005212 [[Candida] haemuloni]PVH22638.1 hypothetical protein CXQ85_005212 [[Candida] haemuloni]
MARLARQQIDPDDISDDDKPPQTGHTFNIWYHKWAGGDRSSNNTVRSKHRLNVSKDSGQTRGNDLKSPICLYFARGCCYKGKNCPFLHRLPKATDNVIPAKDCFGRDKTADYKDDMSGPGSFNRVNKTLYISGLHINDDIEETLSNQFGEFGSIDRVRVPTHKAIGFVMFKHESEAQFAKEAMDGQTLDGTDTLTVRWANSDPNPSARQSSKRTAEDAALSTVKKLLIAEPSNKRFKKEDSPANVYFIRPVNDIPPQNDSEESDNEPEEEQPSSRGLFGSARMAALTKLQSPKPMGRPKTAGRKPDPRRSRKPQFQSKSAINSHFGGYSSDED